jgi:heptosyltransferase I
MDFNPWARISGIIGWFVFDGWTIGFRTRNQARHFLYDAAVEHGPLQHEQRNYLALARAVFPDLKQGTRFRLPLSEADRNSSIAMLERCNLKLGSFVVFHPWSGGYLREQKEWSREKGVQFIEEMDKAGIQVCVTGTGNDLPFASGLPFNDGRVVSLIDRLSIGQLIWVLSLSRAVVSVNTGIMHLAASLDVPLFVLDGPAGEVRWGPVSNAFTRVFKSTFPCSPCLDLGFEYPCKGSLKCMEAIDPVLVAKEVVEYCRSARDS